MQAQQKQCKSNCFCLHFYIVLRGCIREEISTHLPLLHIRSRPEINQSQVEVLIENDVLIFHITVDDTVLVEVVYTGHNL